MNSTTLARIESWTRQLDDALDAVALGRDFASFEHTFAVVWDAAKRARLDHMLEQELGAGSALTDVDIALDQVERQFRPQIELTLK